MKCYHCGSKACYIGKEPEYCYDTVIGVRRRYECKKCGAKFVTIEKREESVGNWDGPVIFNGGR